MNLGFAQEACQRAVGIEIKEAGTTIYVGVLAQAKKLKAAGVSKEQAYKDMADFIAGLGALNQEANQKAHDAVNSIWESIRTPIREAKYSSYDTFISSLSSADRQIWLNKLSGNDRQQLTDELQSGRLSPIQARQKLQSLAESIRMPISRESIRESMGDTRIILEDKLKQAHRNLAGAIQVGDEKEVKWARENIVNLVLELEEVKRRTLS